MPTLISELTPLQSMWLYEHQLTRGDSYEEKWHRFAGPPPGYGDSDPDRRAATTVAAIATGSIFRNRPSKRRLPFEVDEEDRGRGAAYPRRAPSPPTAAVAGLKRDGGGGATGRSAHGPRFPHTGDKLTWAQSRENLKVYYDHYGNCNVPQKYRDNRKLGRWVNKQRKKKKNPTKYGALTAEQVANLDSLGFAWNP